MRIFLLGGWGQLGVDFAEVAGRRHDIIRPRHSELDIADARAVQRAVSTACPDVVIDAAAFHDIAQCESEPALAFDVNAVGALHVARAGDRVGARVVYISTDYVFDGKQTEGYREADPTRPLNVYGITKAAGEAVVRALSTDSLVVRTSGLFGHSGSAHKGPNFVDRMLAMGSRGEALSIVDDQVFSPTAAYDLAKRLLLLLEHRVPPGTYHAANTGACSWYELARRAFRFVGMEANITPRMAVDTLVRRPKFSVLLDTKSRGLGLPPMRPWDEALQWYIAQRLRFGDIT